MDDSCAVCVESLDWVAYGSCGHREVCSTCVVRLRFVLQDPKCCICKTHLDTVFVTKALGHYTRVISDFSAFPPTPSKGQVASLWFHEGSQAYIDDVDHYRMINAMCTIFCNLCEKNPNGQGTVSAKNWGTTKSTEKMNSIDDLKCHLKYQHKMFMCDLCLKGKKVFICEQKLYTQSQLDRHMKFGDLEVDGSENECDGFKGHPICEFCGDFFYGDNELYTHMSTEHYTCHICRRQHPEKHDYFNNYDNLEIHFRLVHFLCEDEACLEKKFVVFQSEAEIKRHNALVHAGTMSRSKRNAALQIPVSFTYRRSNYQSQQHRGGPVIDNQPVGSEDDTVTNLVELPIISSVSRFPQASSGSTHVPDMSSAPNPSNNNQPSISLTADLFPPLPRVKKNKRSKNKVPNIDNNSSTSLLNRKKNSATISNSVQPSTSKNKYISSSSNHVVGSVNFSSFPPLIPLHDHVISSSNPVSSSQLVRPLQKSSAVVSDSNGNSSQKKCVSTTTTVSGGQALVTSEEVKMSNKSVIEKILHALGDDKEKFAAFKCISSEYRDGQINVMEYIFNVEQFGLTHLLSELALLCPDPDKRKALADAYSANIQASEMSDSKGKGKADAYSANIQASEMSDNKGKGKASVLDHNFLGNVKKLQLNQKHHEVEKVEVLSKNEHRSSRSSLNLSRNCSGGANSKTNRKTSKFNRVRLGENSEAAVLNLGHGNANTETTRPESSKKPQPRGLPVKGVWRNNDAKKLFAQ